MAAALLALPARATRVTPTCFGKKATIVGTAGNDELEGTKGADVIIGAEGIDQIRGRGGKDWICGGPGWHRIYCHPSHNCNFGGAERLSGGRGRDHIRGGRHPDAVNGGVGRDVLLGDLGIDLITGGRDDDDLKGGGSGDIVRYKLPEGSAHDPARLKLDLDAGVAEGRFGDDTLSSFQDVYAQCQPCDIFGNGGGNHLVVIAWYANKVSVGGRGGADVVETRTSQRADLRASGGDGPDELRVCCTLKRGAVSGGVGADSIFMELYSGTVTARGKDGNDRLDMYDGSTADVVLVGGYGDDFLSAKDGESGGTLDGGPDYEGDVCDSDSGDTERNCERDSLPI